MTLHDDTIQTILAVGASGVLSLEIALSDIHCEGRERPLATGDRNRLARFGLSARVVFSGAWECCMIYATEPTPEGLFACAECGLALTRTLHEMPDPGPPKGSPKDADYVPEGLFAISRGARDAPPGQVIVNEADVIHTHRLETSARDCCGYFPNAGGEHNLACDNGHPVAFGWSTHWLPRFVGLDPDRMVRLDASSPGREPGTP